MTSLNHILASYERACSLVARVRTQVRVAPLPKASGSGEKSRHAPPFPSGSTSRLPGCEPNRDIARLAGRVVIWGGALRAWHRERRQQARTAASAVPSEVASSGASTEDSSPRLAL